MSLIVESLSSALGAARADVRDLLDTAEARLSLVRANIDCRLGRALAHDGSDAERASMVADIGQDVADPDFRRQVAKLLVSVVGAGWGLSVVSAAISTGGAMVAIGAGIVLEPLIALVLGLVVMFICGKFAWGVIRELTRRIEDFQPQ
jgi:hypothetical protein